MNKLCGVVKISEPLRILQVTKGLHTGGAERLLLDLTVGLRELGASVKILSLTDQNGALAAYGYDEEPAEFVDIIRQPRKSLLKFRRLCRSYQPHIIHAHMVNALAASLISRNRGARICFTSHTEYHPFLRRAFMWGTKWGRDSDILFTDGQHKKLNCQNSITIPNGVPIPEEKTIRSPWSINKGAKFLFLGRLEEAKDPIGLVDAFDQFTSESSTLTIAGDGSLRKYVESRISRSPKPERFKVLGFQKDARGLLRCHDVLVMYSNYEGMPMTMLEAGAEAMPVISTPVGSIPQLLRDGRGFLASKQSFPEVLQYAVEHPDVFMASGEKLKEHIQQSYSIESIAEAHFNLYKDLLVGRKRRPHTIKNSTDIDSVSVFP